MTADRRLRVGGWAALLVAILVPAQLVVLFLGAGGPDPFGTAPYLAAETARIGATLVAVLGLDGLFRSIAPGPARLALAAGGLGAAVGIGGDVVAFAGAAPRPLDTLLLLAANLLVGTWFLVGGGVLMRQGGGLLRIGWTAEIGGFGMILTALAVATRFGGSVGVTGTSLIDWFHLLGLFVVIYLVRVWRYVVGGRLPGPGIL